MRGNGETYTICWALGFQPEGPPRAEEMEESASHHLENIFDFAQLRAEDLQNTTLKPQIGLEIPKFLNFRGLEKCLLQQRTPDINNQTHCLRPPQGSIIILPK